jgi:rubrerythrin
MTTKIDLTYLTVKDALDLAILIEEESRDRYVELADQLGSGHPDDAADFFLTMSKNEEHHRHKLLQKRRSLFGEDPSELSQSIKDELRLTEIPAYEDVRIFMSRRQALNIALKCETRAFNFYNSAISQVKNDEVKKVFASLRDEETEHRNMVKDLIKISSADLRPEVPNEDIDTPSL